MKSSSIIKLLLFIFAIYANLRYLFFILNPIHADNIYLFSLTAFADLIAITILTSTWGTALFFELFKHRYYSEIKDLKKEAHDLGLTKKRVSVLIPIVNEDLTIIEGTMDSIIAMEGDKQIYILDDGKRESVRQLCEAKNRKVKVHYLSRSDRKFFKAGNLNFGLKSVEDEFVVVVDADFQLHKDFLAKTLPFFVDEKIGAVQTPQVYYNEDTLFSKGSKNLQEIFYSYILPAKSLLDSAFCVGTNVVYRKEALDAIGGVALVEHSEDVFTSLKLVEKGYRIFYLREKLAKGLAPSTLISFYNQQFRWARGGLSMLFKHNTLINSKLTIDQRVQFFTSNFFYLSGISVFIYMITPIIAVYFNVKPINDAYFSSWLVDYLLYLGSNLLFYLALAKKNRIQSLILGLFSFIPYIAALFSVFFVKRFNWKPTNALSGELITKILFPIILYIAIAFGLLYEKLLNESFGITPYLFWMAIDTILFCFLVFAGYFAKPLKIKKNTL